MYKLDVAYINKCSNYFHCKFMIFNANEFNPVVKHSCFLNSSREKQNKIENRKAYFHLKRQAYDMGTEWATGHKDYSQTPVYESK